MLRFMLAIMTIYAWSVSAACAQNAPRLALLIGNQSYSDELGRLQNPHRDVALIEKALVRLGFKVTVERDVNSGDMGFVIKRFSEAVRKAGPGAISFFYYSGHGAANPETQKNYLFPVDITDPRDPYLWSRAFQQSEVFERLTQETPNITQYIIFDACRSELQLPASGKKGGVNKGFVPVSDTGGLLVAYSTGPGQTASDIGEGGGPYARALADEIVKPGVEAVAMFRNVQLRVKQSIRQDPWLSFPSLPEVYLAGRAASVGALAASQPPPAAGADDAAAREWARIDKNSPAMLRLFVRRHPDSVFAEYAREQLEELTKSPPAAAAAPHAAQHTSQVRPNTPPPRLSVPSARWKDYRVEANSCSTSGTNTKCKISISSEKNKVLTVSLPRTAIFDQMGQQVKLLSVYSGKKIEAKDGTYCGQYVMLELIGGVTSIFEFEFEREAGETTAIGAVKLAVYEQGPPHLDNTYFWNFETVALKGVPMTR